MKERLEMVEEGSGTALERIASMECATVESVEENRLQFDRLDAAIAAFLQQNTSKLHSSVSAQAGDIGRDLSVAGKRVEGPQSSHKGFDGATGSSISRQQQMMGRLQLQKKETTTGDLPVAFICCSGVRRRHQGKLAPLLVAGISAAT